MGAAWVQSPTRSSTPRVARVREYAIVMLEAIFEVKRCRSKLCRDVGEPLRRNAQ
jgi:hypothetical protein